MKNEGDDKALTGTPTLEEMKPHEKCDASWWTLYIDGAVNNEGDEAGVVLVIHKGHKLSNAIHFPFWAINNDSEYETLINGLKLALKIKVENLNVFSDSSLVV